MDKSKRNYFSRIEYIFKRDDGSWSDVAFVSVSTIFSAMILAVVLSVIATMKPYKDVTETAYITNQANESENIREALVSAWKTLELEHEENHKHNNNVIVSDKPILPKVEPIKIEPKIIYPWNEEITVKVKSGDTIDKILQSKNVGIDDTNAIILALKKEYNPRNIKAEQNIKLQLNHISKDVAKLTNLEIKTSKLSKVEVNATNNKFAAKKTTEQTHKQIAHAGSTITSSFYVAGRNAGLPAPIIMEMMKAYSYDVDFQRDVKPGHKIDVLFEQLVSKDTGNIVGSSGLKYASLTLKRGKKIEIYKYTDRSGNTGYYKPNGESVRKALLKTPVSARISSNFGMRKHPILGYSKMHTGIDFAAKSGTPIHAAGDGVVNFSGRKGGYGNYLKIKHNGKYETAYAHMRNFAKGIRKGKRVKQGQVIGYVGSTGRSTGPHLHYEIIKNGKKINPRGAKFRTGRILKGRDLAAFKEQKTKLKNQLAELPRLREQVAQADIKKN